MSVIIFLLCHLIFSIIQFNHELSTIAIALTEHKKLVTDAGKAVANASGRENEKGQPFISKLSFNDSRAMKVSCPERQERQA